ncbi:hypothetical protein [Streptomyces sp. NPDC020362]|uniref:hypothetical protein n=1 Tax=unclassified Streptomyces TaxID=2593676 RepID=UPI0033F96CB9
MRTEADLDPEDFTKVGEAYDGEEVCARGATSFAATQEDKCGVVTDVGEPFTFHNEDGSQPTVDDLIDTDVNTLGGDSGGLLYDENPIKPWVCSVVEAGFTPCPRCWNRTRTCTWG